MAWQNGVCFVTDIDNLPDPDETAEDIIENLESGHESFMEILNAIKLKWKS